MTSSAPGREPSPDRWQQAVLAHADGPLLVVGGPGSGKTTVLVAAALQRLRTTGPEGPEPLVLTFSRRAASDLRNRVARGLGHTSRPPRVMTVHALCLALQRRFAGPDEPLPRLLTAPEQEFRVRELLLGGGPNRWPTNLALAVGTRTFARQVRSALARARQLGLDPEDLVGMGVAAQRPEWAALGRFFDEYLDVLGHEGSMDYAELVHRTRILLTDPTVLAAVRAEVGAVIVDEYQELDPAQIGLLRELVGTGGTLIAAGDPDQAIFRFRGAHPRGLADFPATFADHDGTPAPVVTLGPSHRVSAGQAAALARVAARLPLPPLGPEATQRLRGEPGEVGDVEVLVCATEPAQAHAIAETLLRAHLDDGVPFGEMAVLVRSGRRQLAALARGLASSGVPVEVAGDEIALGAELAVRPLLLALEIVLGAGQCDADQARRLLTSPLGGVDAIGLRGLSRLLQTTEREAWGSSGLIPSGGELIAAALADPERLAELPDDPQLERLRDLSQLLLAAQRTLAKPGNGAGEVLWTLWSGTDWPHRLRAEANAGGEPGRRADRVLDAVGALFEAAGATGQPPGPSGVRGFLAEIDNQEIPADTERESQVTGRGVRLLTAHRAKGRQWPLVVVAGVQEGVWPDLGRRGGLLHPEELVSEGLVGSPDFRTAIADERRLFYVACSRASRRLAVTAVEGSDGEANQPSRFLAELGVPLRPATPDERPLTLNALVARLRATATDPTASAALRRAAVVRLAALALLPDQHDRPLVPQADPQRWWGVLPTSGGQAAVPSQLRLSATQLSSLLACPRQFYLARRVNADQARSGAAGLGSVIHVLAEHARTDGLTADDLTDELDRVWEAIPFAAAWMSSVERVEAELALTRFVRWQELNADTEVVGVEVPFQVELTVDGQPVTLFGTVDRLERTGEGQVRIVDFKTGRRLPTRAQVEVAEQVGLYQLAADVGAFDEVAGEAVTSAGAVLVYLREPDGVEDYPKALHQASLVERPNPGDDPAVAGYSTWVHQRIAQAAAVVRSGNYPATVGEGCRWCVFTASCPAQSAGGQVIP